MLNKTPGRYYHLLELIFTSQILYPKNLVSDKKFINSIASFEDSLRNQRKMRFKLPKFEI